MRSEVGGSRLSSREGWRLTSATCWNREVARLRSELVASGGSLSGWDLRDSCRAEEGGRESEQKGGIESGGRSRLLLLFLPRKVEF